MANLKDLIVSGPIRAISGVIGDLTGTASKATGDKDGNQIDTTYVKTSRKINGKTLTADITLTASDVSAAASGHKHTSADITALTSYTIATQAAAISATDSLNVALGKIQKSIDSKQASGSYATIGHTHTKSQITDFPTIPTVNNSGVTIKRNGTAIGSFTLNQTAAANIDITVPTTYSDVSAASASHTHSNYVPTSRKVAGKSLTADITLSTSDISGLSDALGAKANSSETYTKSEIDGKLTGAMTFKGTVTTSSALPSTSNKTGDMYNVSDTGANYAWDGTAWDKLSENIDLSGCVPNTRKINSKTLNADITLTYTDVGAASSGHTHAYVPTSRKINSKQLTADISLTYTDVSAASSAHTHSDYVPTSRTVNSKALTSNISLTYSDVGAASSSHTHTKSQITDFPTIPTVNNSGVTIKRNGTAIGSFTLNQTSAANIDITVPTTYSDVSAASSGHTHSNYVPTSRTINSKQLTSNITLTYSDVGALSAATTIPTVNNGATTIKRNGTAIGTITANQATAASIDISVPTTYSDVSAASSGHTHSGYVPTSRTINSKQLTANISLTYSDVGALSAATTIPTVNNSGVTIKRNGTAIGSFTLNQTSAANIDISVPTITDTYSSTSTNGMSGKAVASALGSYVKKAGDTMTGALNFANNVWNNMGDDAAIGDCNVGGHIGIKQLNGSSCGFQFYNSSGTALAQLNANSGNITSSGSLGISNNACTLQYNSTTEAVEFVFA